jgi:hypothetical protein
VDEGETVDLYALVIGHSILDGTDVTSLSNVDFDVLGVFFVVPDVLKRAGQLNDELHSVLVELHLGRSNDDECLVHLGGRDDSSSVETDGLAEHGTVNPDTLIFVGHESVDGTSTAGEELNDDTFLSVGSETNTQMSKRAVAELFTLSLELEQETVSIHKFVHHNFVGDWVAVIEVSVSNNALVISNDTVLLADGFKGLGALFLA